MVSYEEDINESLRILFGTVPGERLMHPGYGCRLKALVFEPLDDGTLAEIRHIIERAILFHETRITAERVDATPSEDPHQDGRIDIRIEYTIRTTNTRANLVYPFYLREGSATGGASGG